MTPAEIRERCHEANPKALCLDGLDSAIIGFGRQHGSDELLIYSAKKIVKTLMKNEKMTYDAALEWFYHNTECAYFGPGTPIIMSDIT